MFSKGNVLYFWIHRWVMSGPHLHGLSVLWRSVWGGWKPWPNKLTEPNLYLHSPALLSAWTYRLSPACVCFSARAFVSNHLIRVLRRTRPHRQTLLYCHLLGFRPAPIWLDRKCAPISQYWTSALKSIWESNF